MGSSQSFAFDKKWGEDWGDGSMSEKEKQFLSSYTKEELEQGIDKFLLPKLEAQGYDKAGLTLDVDTSDPFVHVMTVSHKRLEALPKNAFLIKLFVRRRNMKWQEFRHLQPSSKWPAFEEWLSLLPEDLRDLRAPFSSSPLAEHLEFIKASVLEYVFMQNPLRTFADRPERPKLPEQLYPSLGAGKEFGALVQYAAAQHERDMVLNYPECFHNAYIYNRSGMRFLSPHVQALFEILVQDLAKDLEQDFAKTSWAIFEGKLRFRGKPALWVQWEQAFPISKFVRDFVLSMEHVKDQLLQATKPLQPLFSIAWD